MQLQLESITAAPIAKNGHLNGHSTSEETHVEDVRRGAPEALDHLPITGPGPRPDCDFDWRDTDAVVIPTQPAIAVYFNPRGDVVIRQESPNPYDEEDHFIYLQRKNLRALIERLQQIERGQIG